MAISAMVWFICAFVLGTVADQFTSSGMMPTQWDNIRVMIMNSSAVVFVVSVCGTALWAVLSSFRKEQVYGQ